MSHVVAKLAGVCFGILRVVGLTLPQTLLGRRQEAEGARPSASTMSLDVPPGFFCRRLDGTQGKHERHREVAGECETGVGICCLYELDMSTGMAGMLESNTVFLGEVDDLNLEGPAENRATLDSRLVLPSRTGQPSANGEETDDSCGTAPQLTPLATVDITTLERLMQLFTSSEHAQRKSTFVKDATAKL